MIRILAALVLGLFLSMAFGAGCTRKAATKPDAAPGDSAPMPKVRVTTVQVGDIAETLPSTGTLNAMRSREATLSPSVSGLLDALPVHFGQTVASGQVVAHLSTAPLMGQIQQLQATINQNQVQVDQARMNALQQQAQTRTAILQAQSALSGAQSTTAGAEATLAGYEATLQNASETLTRQKSLFSDGLVAKKDVEAAQLAYRTAESQVASQRTAVQAQRTTVASQRQALAAARAASLQDVIKLNEVQIAREQVRNATGALATVRNQLSLYTIRAPLAGEIIVLGASTGETVDTTTKLMTIANLDMLQLDLAVPAESAHKIHVGELIEFHTDGMPKKNFLTAVSTIGSQVDPASNTIHVLGLISNSAHLMKDNTQIHADIVIARRQFTLNVPKSSVLFDAEGKASVAVIGPDQVVHLRDIKTGLTQDGHIEIVSGLKAGEQVATTGSYGLPDGTKVEIDTGETPKADTGKAKAAD